VTTAGRDVAARHYPPFYAHLGIELDGGESAMLRRRSELTNSRGAFHGGALASLLDAALAQAIRSVVKPGTNLATIDMSVHFLTPADCMTVTARGRVLRLGGTVAYAEAEVVTDGGALVAHGVGSFRLLAQRGVSEVSGSAESGTRS
jgi:uncharacterized protein (TIGR00369 family)